MMAKDYTSLAMVSSLKARMDAAEWLDICISIRARKKDRVAYMRQLAAQGVAPFATIRNKFYTFEADGDGALIDRRRCRILSRQNPWVECFKTYIENDRNTMMGGFRQMMADFRRGIVMPGSLGTWRDVWRRERPNLPVPAECPYDWVPHGATFENLRRAAQTDSGFAFAIAASRQGRT